MHEHIMSDADQERADAIKNAILDLCLQQKVNALIALSATRCASECFEEIIREQGGEVFTVATPSPSLAAREAAERCVDCNHIRKMNSLGTCIHMVRGAICGCNCTAFNKSPVPAAGGDESTNAWSKWFARLGDKASANVVNATADLVTDERLAALVQAGVLPKADSVGEEGK